MHACKTRISKNHFGMSCRGWPGNSKGEDRGIRMGGGRGGLSGGIAPPQKTFWLSGSKWYILVCILRTILPRDAHASYRYSAVYARVWCMSVCLPVCHKAVFYYCRWTYNHAINRKLRWTTVRGCKEGLMGYALPEIFRLKTIMHSDIFCAVILVYIHCKNKI